MKVLTAGNLGNGVMAKLAGTGFETEKADDADSILTKILLGSQVCVIVAIPFDGLDSVDIIRQIRVLDAKVGIVVVAKDPAQVERAIDGLDVFAVVGTNVTIKELAENIRDASDLATIDPASERRLVDAMKVETDKLKQHRRDSGHPTQVFLSPEDQRKAMGQT